MSLRRPSRKDALNFAAGRTSRAIIASFSLLAIALIGGTWIEEYVLLSRDAAQMDVLQAEFDEAHRRRQKLLSIESKVKGALTRAKERGVGPDDIEFVRESLISIARDAGASLRRLEVGENEVRAWSLEQDDPRNDTAPLYGENSSFVLHKHAVQIQADGGMEAIRKVLEEINNRGWLVSTKNLSIGPTSSVNAMTSIEVTMVLYGLEPAPENLMEEEEDFAMRTNARQFR
jgi:hypothetical protein